MRGGVTAANDDTPALTGCPYWFVTVALTRGGRGPPGQRATASAAALTWPRTGTRRVSWVT